MITEGSRVAYVGDDPLRVGEEGMVISSSGMTVHVSWDGGGVDMHRADDVIPLAKKTRQSIANQVDYSMEDPGLSTVAVRHIYDSEGDVGLLTALSDAGYTSSLQEYAEEAISTVASRIRRDPTFQSVLTQLDPEEADSLVALTSAVVLRDAFGGSDDD